MNCHNCSSPFKPGDKFCNNCGATLYDAAPENQNLSSEDPNNLPPQVNVHSSFPDQTAAEPAAQNNLPLNSGQQMTKVNINDYKKKPVFLYIIASFVIVIVLFTAVFGAVLWRLYKSDNPFSSQITDTDNSNRQKPNGIFTREIFSDRTYYYKDNSSTVKFSFDFKTFEALFDSGTIYRGTYEVYNGLNIGPKADEVEKDRSIYYGDLLANDIKKVSSSMINKSSVREILDIYLLYLEVDEKLINGQTEKADFLQPFVIKFDSEKRTGVAVNIMGQEQGTFAP